MGKHKKRHRSRSSDRHTRNSRDELLKRISKLEQRLERSEKDRHRSRSPRRRSKSRHKSRERNCGSLSRSELRRDRYSRHDSRSRSTSVSSSIAAGGILASAVDTQRAEETLYAGSVRSHRSVEPDADETNDAPGPAQVNAALEPPSPELIIHNDVTLPDDVLDILGIDPSASKSPGYVLHGALASRWNHILRQGLPKEESQQLLDKCGIPDNCRPLSPPEVNPELKIIMPSLYSVRDSSHQKYQFQLGRGISALGQAMNLILEEGENIPRFVKDVLLSHMSNSSRILCHLFNDISKTRRHLIGPLLSKQVKELVEQTPPGDLLFGPELGEQLKAAKLLEKTGMELCPPLHQGTFTTFKKGGRVGGVAAVKPQTIKTTIGRAGP